MVKATGNTDGSGAPGNTVDEAPEMTIDDFLKSVEDSDTLKGMFAHFTRVTDGPQKGTKADLEKAFADFKEMPADKLK